MRTRIDAWYYRGFANFEPGEFEIGDGRIRYAQNEAQLFDVAVADISVKWPWYEFGGGCRVRFGGENYKFAFMSPAAAGGIGALFSIGSAWKAARAFKDALR
jgi:hypothetical protein